MFRLLPLFVALASMAAPSAARAAWQRAESSHFVIYSDDRPERVKTFADRLERFDGATRVALKLNDPSRTESQKLTVYMLRDIDAVARLARMGSAAGFYHSRASGSVAFLPRQTEASAWWSPQTEAIFFHEYAHHLQLQFSSVALPLWTREGFAEFFATADVRKDGSVAIGGVPVYRAYGLLSGQGISVQSMVGATYGRLDPMQMDSIYGQGWLLTHYLTFNDARKGQLNRYVGDIQKGMTPLDAAKDAFGDLKKLADELNKYRSQRLVGVIVPAARIAVAKIEVRALTAGQAALMPVHLRSTRGVTLQAAPALAAQARQLAAPFPQDAFAQRSLAEAELDARNFAAASAAASRAIAADPTDPHALILKGRAEMGLAAAAPANANWSEVRRWFTRANKLDTEYAEPLAEFYRSFEAAGQAPTANAVSALLYAVDLAPQDDELRIDGARELLKEKRVAEAKTMFAPLAYAPHSSREGRERNMKIMSAIDATDVKTALSLIDEARQLAIAEAQKP